jgi:ubiquinol-cytochrome c reductase cytochrome b subunit
VKETSAADLKGFASREWLTEFMSPDHIETDKYWGNTAFVNPEEGDKKSKMVDFLFDEVAEYGDEEKTMLEELIVGLSAEAKLPAQVELDAAASETITQLPELLEELTCLDCHHFQGEGRRPDLTGYGSVEWMTAFIQDPSHKRFYGDRNDRMPSYGAVNDKPAKLSDREIGLIVEWMRTPQRETP